MSLGALVAFDALRDLLQTVFRLLFCKIDRLLFLYGCDESHNNEDHGKDDRTEDRQYDFEFVIFH